MPRWSLLCECGQKLATRVHVNACVFCTPTLCPYGTAAFSIFVFPVTFSPIPFLRREETAYQRFALNNFSSKMSSVFYAPPVPLVRVLADQSRRLSRTRRRSRRRQASRRTSPYRHLQPGKRPPLPTRRRRPSRPLRTSSASRTPPTAVAFASLRSADEKRRGRFCRRP